MIALKRFGQPGLDRDLLRSRVNDELQTGNDWRAEIVVPALLRRF